MKLSFAELDSPIGAIRVVVHQGAVCALGWNIDDDLKRRFGKDLRLEPGAEEEAARITAYLAGDLRAFNGMALDAAGTGFQRAVWALLLEIPAGQTWSYGELARRLGRPSASRAVGAANGANPIAIAVPCHRVIGASGALTGYGSGIERKRWLLAHESNRLEQGAQIALFGERIDDRQPQRDPRR